jgi:carboxylate-amine ligase
VTSDYRVPTIGVEEEYELVSKGTGELSPAGRAVLRFARDTTTANIQHELHLEQIEMASPILRTSSEVRDCLLETRSALMEAAGASGAALVATGTNPMPLPANVMTTPKPRYLEMEQEYQALARELIICGCHIHIDMPDKEVGVQVMNFTRAWLPLLQAMSANSPYWNGEDTGYASYRRELWARWPMAGVPGWFDDYADYKNCMRDLIRSRAIDDETKVYWDTRLPLHLPTLEFRVFDVQTEIEDCVALVAITQALAMRCEALVRRGEHPPRLRREPLRSAMWRAARYGLSQQLIDPIACEPVDAFQLVGQLIAFVEEPLDVLGDKALVDDYVARLRSRGVPAECQRRVFRESQQSLRAVVEYLVARTVPDSPTTNSFS